MNITQKFSRQGVALEWDRALSFLSVIVAGKAEINSPSY